jgi:hypothetical protein
MKLYPKLYILYKVLPASFVYLSLCLPLVNDPHVSVTWPV